MERPEGRMRLDEAALEAGRLLSPTLDEPVRETIMRDARSIGYKLLYVLKPQRLISSSRSEMGGLKQYVALPQLPCLLCRGLLMLPRMMRMLLPAGDLWGPLLLCVFLSVVLYTQASLSWPAAAVPATEQNGGGGAGGGTGAAAAVLTAAERAERRERQRVAFSLVYIFVSVGASVVTVNAKLLGSAQISFFQSVCVLGYCLFPLNIAAFVNLFIGRTLTLVKLLLAFVALRWSAGASIAFLSEMVPDEKRALAVYPVWLFYTAMAWIICSA